MATPTNKRTTAPAFQFYPKDFISSTKVQRMTLTEVGAYIFLLSHCWLNDGLPSDVGEIAKIVKIPAPRFVKMWRGALSECFVEHKGRYVNERLNEERKKQAEFRRRQSDNGKAGGRPKKSQKKGLGSSGLSQPKAKKSSPISDLQSPNTSVPSEQSSAHPVKEFLTLYEQQFMQIADSAPHITGRDAKIAKDVIAKHGREKAHELLRAFFNSNDPFIQQCGYGLNIFAGQINKLLVGDRQTSPVGSTPRTAQNYSELQAFVNRGKSA